MPPTNAFPSAECAASTGLSGPAVGATWGQGFRLGAAAPLPPGTPAAWWSCRLPRREQSVAGSPFDAVRDHSPVRTRRRTVLALAHHVESLASPALDPPILLTALQRGRHFGETPGPATAGSRSVRRWWPCSARASSEAGARNPRRTRSRRSPPLVPHRYGRNPLGHAGSDASGVSDLDATLHRISDISAGMALPCPATPKRPPGRRSATLSGTRGRRPARRGDRIGPSIIDIIDNGRRAHVHWSAPYGWWWPESAERTGSDVTPSTAGSRYHDRRTDHGEDNDWNSDQRYRRQPCRHDRHLQLRLRALDDESGI